MTSSYPNADSTNDKYDIRMQTSEGSAFGPGAHVINYHYGSPQPQVSLEEAYFDKMGKMTGSLLKKIYSVGKTRL
jgi:hypothetical protein